MLIHPLAKACEFLRFYRDIIPMAPDELTTLPALLTSLSGDPVMGLLVGYVGPIGKGEATLRPLREFGVPLADQIRPMAYKELQTILDPMMPWGLYNYWKSSFLTAMSDTAIDTLIAHFAVVPSPLTVVVLEQLGGAVSRIGRHETAFNLRDGEHNLAIASRWTDPGETEHNIRWTRELWEAMQPYSSAAVYVNYLGGDESATRIKAAYGANYDRLAALKNRYDPTNFFSLNHNILPTA
jgi:hypothetical protein